MIRKLLIAVALLAAGCDNPAVLANIDTYTCAYLPGVVDCTTQEVHDKAVSILTDGLIAGEVSCAGTYTEYTAACPHGTGLPSGVSPTGVTGTFNYKAQKLQDGTCFVNWSSGPSKDIGFIARSNSYAESCEVDLNTYMHLSATGGEVVVSSTQPSYRIEGNSPLFYCAAYSTADTVFDMETQCTGFNFDAFGSAP